MPRFPALEPELRERLLLDPDAFDAFISEYLAAVPPRPYGPEQLEFALTYPWARPETSYLLAADGEVRAPDLDRAKGRHPVLAFGSNAAPSTLQRKFAHFEDPQDREILVVAGELHDYDVGPAASVAVYGAMPATLFASPGTRVRAAVLFATDNQATQLTWSELSYVFGRLEVTFAAELEVTSVLAYASRFGTFCPDGEPPALAAVPATDRRAAPRTQRELLDVVGGLTGIGSAEAVVRAVYAGPGPLIGKLRDHVRPLAQPFSATGWTPYAP